MAEDSDKPPPEGATTETDAEQAQRCTGEVESTEDATIEAPLEQVEAWAGEPPPHDETDPSLGGDSFDAQPPVDNDETLTERISTSDRMVAQILGEVQRIGPYRILGLLGQGAMGIVFRAAEARGDEIALKVLTVTPALRPHELQRFLREADASRQLRRHPNIITIYNTGHDGSHHYIAMELVPGGKTLRDHVQKTGLLSIREALQIGIAVGKALEFAHSHGIIHRDPKPANILINEFAQPLLADFGLAKAVDSTDLTMSGTVLGTPCYMSPEQAGHDAKDVTAQSDIYSFGVVLYELLTGKMPYEIGADMRLPEVFRTVCQVEPTSARKHRRRDISRNLNAVLMKMLEKETGRRYAAMSAAVADLEACLAGRSVSVRNLTPGEKFEKRLRKHKLLSFVIISSLVSITAIYMLKQREERDMNYHSLIPKLSAQSKSNQVEKLLGQGTEEQIEGDRLHDQVMAAVAAGDYAAARQHLAAMAAWAAGGAGSGDTLYEGEDDDRYGFILVGRHLLARLDLADGNYLPAAKALRQLSVEYESAVIGDPGAGLQTFNGQLAHFESAVALWQAQQSARALTLFAALVPPPVDGQPTFDPDNAATYIGSLAAAMGDNASRGQLLVAAEELPVVFRGLAYWVLAQHQKVEHLEAGYLDKANETIGNLLIWPRVIGKEGDHVQHPEER